MAWGLCWAASLYWRDSFLSGLSTRSARKNPESRGTAKVVQDFIPLFKSFGVWVGILIVVTYFLIRHWWPYWKAKDEKREVDRQLVLTRMVTVQETSLREMTEALRANSRLSEKISDNLQDLRESFKGRSKL